MKLGGEQGAKLVRTVAVVAFLIAAAVGGWAMSRAMLGSKDLLVKEIQVVGHSHLQRDEVLTLAGLDRPKSTLQLNKEAVRARLLANPWVQSAEVLRPGREIVRIELVESIPRLILAAPHLVLVDAEGRVIDRASPAYEHLPLLTGASRKLPSKSDEAQVDPQTLELSRGLGGALVQDFSHEIVDGGVVRDAVSMVDVWQQLDEAKAWPVIELSWDPAEGFTMVVGTDVDVDIVLGHQELKGRLLRAYASLEAAHTQTDRLERVDVRPSARAVLRFHGGERR